MGRCRQGKGRGCHLVFYTGHAKLIADPLRPLLDRGDLHGALDALTLLLPGQPGSATYMNVLSGLRVYLRWIEDTGHSLLNVQDHHAQAYSIWLAAQYAPATHKNRLTQVCTFYDLLQGQGL